MAGTGVHALHTVHPIILAAFTEIETSWVRDLGVSHNLQGTVAGNSVCPKYMCVCVVHLKSLIDPDDMWHRTEKGTEQPVSNPQNCKGVTVNLMCFHCIIHNFIKNLIWFVLFFPKVYFMFRAAWKNLHRFVCGAGGGWY